MTSKDWATMESQVSLSLIVGAASVAFLLWKVWQWIFNIYFHPLSKFPGPPVAAATGWWKTYIELVKQQSMVDYIAKLHEIHGKSANGNFNHCLSELPFNG